MASAPPWPDHPVGAHVLGHHWLVPRLPPSPWPQTGPDYGALPEYGPPGTQWVFTLSSLIDRETLPGTSDGTREVIERLLRKLGTVLPPLFDLGVWETPQPLRQAPPVEQELTMPMTWIRAQIVGALGADEEVVHTLQLRHATIENAEVTPAITKAVGDAVRDGFAAFVNSQKNLLPFPLIYTEVRTAVLTQAAPGARPVWPQPTQVSPFSANPLVRGAGQPGDALPYEVAHALSFNANTRGTSRFRGRLYLGPLDKGIMGDQGQFAPNLANQLGTQFGVLVLAAIEANTDYEAHVISEKYGTSAKITGIRAGATPDSQRRRRRSRPENYAQVWGTPVGAL